MRKIVDYYLISAPGLDHFDKIIKDRLEDGWQPFGSPSLANDLFIQAIVKYEKEEKVVISKNFKPPTKRAIMPTHKPYTPEEFRAKYEEQND